MAQYKILLDERLYRTTKEQRAYLGKCLEVFKKYFHAKIAIFEPYYDKKSYAFSASDSSLKLQILRTNKFEKFNYDEVTPCSCPELNAIGFTNAFIGKIFHILSSNKENIVIIPFIQSGNHRELKKKQYTDRVFFIGNIDQEINSNISMWIKQDEVLKLSCPSEDCLFPAAELCNGFDKWRSEILHSFSSNKIALFSNISLEVALRNKYEYSSKLTAINKAKAKKDKKGNPPKRQVFIGNEGEAYLSSDFENGGFEVYNKKPIHMGQYRFNGIKEKEADNAGHPLYLK